MSYDSTADTLLHIQKVANYLNIAAAELLKRAIVHDASKLKSPEKELYDELTPRLAGLTYGTEEYFKNLEDLKPALDHHYKNNSHHPEHHVFGIDDMTLFDVIEMFFDWKAASERHKDGDIHESIKKNEKRFEMSSQLASIFERTVLDLEARGIFEIKK